MRFGLIFFTMLFFIAACKKKIVSTDTAPIISQLQVNSMQVNEFVDTISITFNYEDKEGDLGSPDPNIKVLKVKDSRLNAPDAYHVKPLSPQDQAYHIKGALTVKLNSLFLLGNSNQERLTFSVTIRDNNGNESNELISDTVLVYR